MAAATVDREVSSRQQGDIVEYTGSSGYKYLIGCMTMKDLTGSIIRPVALGVTARFLGVNRNRVDLTAGLGSSQAPLEIYKTGIFTFKAAATGASNDIGMIAYAYDDQTVGTSFAAAGASGQFLPVGEIVGYIDTATYRVRIDNFVGTRLDYSALGLSSLLTQN